MRRAPPSLSFLSSARHYLRPVHRRRLQMRASIVLLTVALPLAACGGGGSTTSTASRPARSHFSPTGGNPHAPPRPGPVWRYRGVKDGHPTVNVVTVTRKTK